MGWGGVDWEDLTGNSACVSCASESESVYVRRSGDDRERFQREFDCVCVCACVFVCVCVCERESEREREG